MNVEYATPMVKYEDILHQCESLVEQLSHSQQWLKFIVFQIKSNPFFEEMIKSKGIDLSQLMPYNFSPSMLSMIEDCKTEMHKENAVVGIREKM